MGSAPQMGASRLSSRHRRLFQHREIYGELRDAWRGLWLGESGPWGGQQMHCAVLGQHFLPMLCWEDPAEQETSVKPAPSHIHANPSMHAFKSVLERNSTTLFIPQAADSSRISQPGPKGLKWDVNFKAGLWGSEQRGSWASLWAGPFSPCCEEQMWYKSFLSERARLIFASSEDDKHIIFTNMHTRSLLLTGDPCLNAKHAGSGFVNEAESFASSLMR